MREEGGAPGGLGDHDRPAPRLPAGAGERAHSAHTRALAFAAEAARRADARGPIPEVARIAAHRATSGYVRAARALHGRLDR
nr:hypothetical protein GCM10020093_028320 [Planobispora longispora]